MGKLEGKKCDQERWKEDSRNEWRNKNKKKIKNILSRSNSVYMGVLLHSYIFYPISSFSHSLPSRFFSHHTFLSTVLCLYFSFLFSSPSSFPSLCVCLEERNLYTYAEHSASTEIVECWRAALVVYKLPSSHFLFPCREFPPF